MHVARMPVRRASVQEEYTMKEESPDQMICWRDVDVPPWFGNRRRTPIAPRDVGMPLTSDITDQTKPLRLQAAQYSSNTITTKMKTSAMDATARICSFGSDIGDLALHQPIRNVGRTCSVANCELRQCVDNTFPRESQTCMKHNLSNLVSLGP